MIDPVQAFAAATSVSPIPSVVPTVPSYQHASASGERILWVVFAIMVVSSAIFSVMAYSVPMSKRLFHVITTIITVIAACSYFAMANGSGVSYHKIKVVEQHKHTPNTVETIYREVYWARYVDWSLTTPLLLLDLCLLAGMNGGNILIAIVADLIMVLTGLFAAFGTEETSQKWGWYTIACLAYLVIVWQVAVHGRAGSMAKGSKSGKFFLSLALFTGILWTLYPIVWGVADGARIAGLNSEIAAYGILDVLAKPVFGAWLLIAHTKLESSFEVGGFWSNGLGGEGGIHIGDDDGA